MEGAHSASDAAPAGIERSSFSVSFPLHGGIRTELERAPVPFREWWRARVRGGLDWRVPNELPWSYGISETGAVEAAVSLWALAGQPASATPASVDEADVPVLPVTPDEERSATLVAIRADRKKLVKYDLFDPVRTVVRAVTNAVLEGAATVRLTRASGRSVRVNVASIVDLYDDLARAAPEVPSAEDATQE